MSEEKFYLNGGDSTVAWVGVSGNYNYVVRYSFKTPAAGARSISASFEPAGTSSGTITSSNVYWYVTTSSTSHINVKSSSAASYGAMTWTGTYLRGTNSSANLAGNTTYYLYVWNASNVSSVWIKWYYTGGSASPTITFNS